MYVSIKKFFTVILDSDHKQYNMEIRLLTPESGTWSLILT